MILVVDNSSEISRLIKIYNKTFEILKNVKFFTSGNLFLSFLKTVNTKELINIQLILLDDNLPDLEGLNVLKTMKDDCRFSSIPVILIMKGDKSKLLPQAFKYGAIDYIHKPIEEFEFLARVKSRIDFSKIINSYAIQEKELQDQLYVLHYSNEVLLKSSGQDQLTKLANRRQFDISFENQWNQAKRYNSFLTIVLMDIDYFKKYNDFYGHQFGDTCLQKVAEIIRKSVRRPIDLIARYGGEEFVLILPKITMEGAINVAKSIHKNLNSLAIPHEKSDVSDIVTISIGIATMKVNKNSKDSKELVQVADKMLYLAKDSGRNQYKAIKF